MSGKLKQEIHQHRDFASLEAEAVLNILRTADALGRSATDYLKPRELTPAQFNVLRILRGAGADGLNCREISQRLIKFDPDVTRLLDRLEKRGLVLRQRESQDRRVITVRITTAGLAILKQLDRKMLGLHKQQIGHLSERQLKTLIRLLEMARDNLR
ncbi:MAG: MarR family transcriptional regulator [Acidobacteria bacterium]|nr:MarR family transcriptional regulator [Acidobacteriota bacterium]